MVGIPFDHPIMGNWTQIYITKGWAEAEKYAYQKQLALRAAIDAIQYVQRQDISALSNSEQELMRSVKAIFNDKLRSIAERRIAGTTPYSKPRQWLYRGFEEAEVRERGEILLRYARISEGIVALQTSLAKKRISALSFKPVIDILNACLEKNRRRDEFFKDRQAASIFYIHPYQATRIRQLKDIGLTGKTVTVVVQESGTHVKHIALEECINRPPLEKTSLTDKEQQDADHIMKVCGLIAAKATGLSVHEGAAPSVKIEMFDHFKHIPPATNSKLINYSYIWALKGEGHVLKRKQEGIVAQVVDAINGQHKRLLIQAIGNGVKSCGVNISLNDSLKADFFVLNYPDILENLILVQSITFVAEDEVRLAPSSNLPGYLANTCSLCAPGTDLLTTSYKEGISNFYSTCSGTSMATAMVSGAAALILEAVPELTVSELKHCLLSGASRIAFNKGIAKIVKDEIYEELSDEDKKVSSHYFGCGLLNAEKSLAKAKEIRRKRLAILEDDEIFI